MPNWTEDQLSQIGNVEEVRIASVRRDGALGKPVTTWVVRHGDDLYVRSVKGRHGQWFRGVQRRHQGQIRARGVEANVTFAEAEADIGDDIDASYRTKYRRYAGAILNSVLTPDARSATLKLLPR